MISKKLIFCAVIFFSWSATANCRAAGVFLYSSPASKNVTVGQKFSVAIYVNTGGEAINAVRATLSYPNEELSLLSITETGSIIRFWAPEPSFSDSAGIMNFGGGLPTPGYNGLSGKIVTLNFQAKKAGEARLSFTAGSVLANDGKGTNVLSAMNGGNYKIVAKSGSEENLSTKETSTTKTTIANPNITSSTHPDQASWYNNRNIKFNWEIPVGVMGVSILLNQESQADPGPIIDGLFSEKEYDNLKDGIWYLHLKVKNNTNWSEISNFRVQIDTVPPLPFVIEINQEEFSTNPQISFEAIDQLSGIDYYEVNIDNQEAVQLNSGAGIYSLVGVLAGKHFVIVKAVDRAGNKTVATAEIMVDKLRQPVIDGYGERADADRTLFIVGSAPGAEKVNLYLRRQGEDKIDLKTAPVFDGRWFFSLDDKLPHGEYVFWAESVNRNGLKSDYSSKQNIRIPWLTIKITSNFASLLFFGLLTIIMMFMIFIKVRRRE